MAISIDLENRVVIVTGGSGSIGAAIVDRFLDAGAKVGVLDKSDLSQDLISNSTSENWTQRRLFVETDLTETSSVDSGIKKIADELGTPSILVNAGGVLKVGPLQEGGDQNWLDSMNVNVLGAMRATRGVLSYLRTVEFSNIVNIGSVAANIGSADGSPYTASKGAVISMTYAHAGELAPYGIRVNCVSPGWVEGGFTEMGRKSSKDPEQFMEFARSLHYLGRIGKPSEIANAVLWLASPLASFVTGTNLIVDGGYSIKHG